MSKGLSSEAMFLLWFAMCERKRYDVNNLAR